MHEKPLISVVLPAKDESAGIGKALERIHAVLSGCGADVEFVVVDDGSGDDTFERLRALRERFPGLKGLRFSRNFGKEAALLAGLRATSGEAVVTMDSDLQHPPEALPEMIARWREGARIVHGVKADRSVDNPIRRARAAVFNALITRLGGIDMAETSDFKLLDRSVVEILACTLPERLRFYRGLTQWVGYPQAKVPFKVAERTEGASKFSVRALMRLAVTALVSFSSAPLHVVGILGVLTLLLGLGVGVEALWSWFAGKAVSGYATIIMTLLIIGSFIMISLGVIGEYIAKIYEEIKGRPMYLVRESCGFEDEDDPRGPRPVCRR